jgi:hypothetical protein
VRAPASRGHPAPPGAIGDGWRRPQSRIPGAATFRLGGAPSRAIARWQFPGPPLRAFLGYILRIRWLAFDRIATLTNE